NDCPDCGDFLSLNLRLPLEGVGFETRKLEGFPTGLIPSRTAFGAVAILDRGNGNKSIAYVDGGSGHSGQKSPQVHFGLGKSSHGKDLKVQLNWRDTKGKVHQKDMLFRPGAHTVYLGDLKESS
ncbi:RNA-binding protein, partial [bacterium]|nr:RNA-binding protein [bacterium]